MSRFKQVWLSFWRKDQGIGMIETALLLPIFLMFVFAVIDFGNRMVVKNRMVSAAQAVASAIQNNPTMSEEDLEKVKATSLGDIAPFSGYAIWTSKTPPTVDSSPEQDDATFLNGIIQGAGSSFWSQNDITNPWLADADPSNDNNAYYVSVFLYKGIHFLTPLPKMLGFTPATTAGFGVSAEHPNGGKTAQVFTFVTLNNASCPADQVLQSKTGGLATCVPRDNNYACAAGQTLEKIIDGNPVCVAKDGTYTCASDQVLKEINNGAAVCVNRDRDFNCGDYQLLQKRVNNQEFCGDPGTNYVCPPGQVLQATYTFDPVCVDNHTGVIYCAPGEVVIGVINGIPQCSAPPSTSTSTSTSTSNNFGGFFTFQDGDCHKGNPYVVVDGLAQCMCPTGMASRFILRGVNPGQPGTEDLYWCSSI